VKVSEVKEELLAKTAVILEEIPSYGRCVEVIAKCLRKDETHKTAERLARDILLLVANGADREKILKWVDTRARMAHPERIHTFALDGLVPFGNKDAKVTIVEFSDFQCPFCAKVAPVLEKAINDSNGKARLFFKQFPIKSHPRALAASKACVASARFGKFWEYCNRLFDFRSDLSDENFLELAKDCGIDAEKFKQEMSREGVISRIADEKMEGLKSRIAGTPAVFVNGKELVTEPTAALLRDRIEEELDILHGRD
jgi:protein-disulfide isomerase